MFDENLAEIITKINNLYKKKNYSSEEFINTGENIFKIMNKNKNIDRKKINNYYIKNIVDKDISQKDKIKYYNFVKKINNFIEIEEAKVIIAKYICDKNYKNENELQNVQDIKKLFLSLNGNKENKNIIIDYLLKILVYILKNYLNLN